jgi:hypothetical protein
MIRAKTVAALLSLAWAALATSPAQAQWSRITEIPPAQLFSLFTNADTIVAGADTSLFLSTDGGATWQGTRRPVAGVQAMTAALLHDGRVFAGTFGQGVFVSDDLGATWQSFNEGLTGGFLDSQLFLSGLVVLGDSLYASTEGAGVYVRNLAGGGWSPFGEEFEPNQSSNVTALALGGSRLMACAGANGTVLVRDPGDPDWTLSLLGNTRLLPGATPLAAAWTGTSWVVGTTRFLFLSSSGEEPWTPVDPGLFAIDQVWFAVRDGVLFAAFSLDQTAVIEESDDGGATWNVLDVLPGVFVFQMATVGDEIYAARADGLWRREVPTVSVGSGGRTSTLHFAVIDQPVRESARFHFEVPRPGPVRLDVFDVAGRRSAALEATWPAGAHEWTLNTAGLAPGVYAARLTAGPEQRTLTMVHLR